eukprot:Pgem_evm1s15064
MVYFQKPENALKRATELIEVGKNSSALEVLYDVISNKRNRQWSTTMEEIIHLFLDLCTEQRKFKTAKDGLHQYKNICIYKNTFQQFHLDSLESVMKAFVAKAEA